MPGARWFPDARLNFAHNLLRSRDAHDAIIGAIETLLCNAQAPRTADIGGNAGTADVGSALAQIVASA